jgi:hypothetical protein
MDKRFEVIYHDAGEDYRSCIIDKQTDKKYYGMDQIVVLLNELNKARQREFTLPKEIIDSLLEDDMK